MELLSKHTESVSQRGSSVEDLRVPFIKQNDSLQAIKSSIGTSSLQNQQENKFFGGYGSVKDLVKSYEELPNKEKVEVEVVLSSIE
jgi:hypothetical protein